jgi:protocatechuate 3,4-dioxygenase beta subunit
MATRTTARTKGAAAQKAAVGTSSKRPATGKTKTKVRPGNFEQDITDIVISRIAPTTPPRVKQVMGSLIRHLHDFIREVELTEAEWEYAIGFLTRTGHMCDDKRQEFILLSDTLGVTMLTDAINHPKPGSATESTIFGPFYRAGARSLPLGASVQTKEGGEPTVMMGRVLSEDGQPLANAILDVWETDEAGFYDSQIGDGSNMNLRGLFRTNRKGEYWFKCIKPVAYPIPDDGPVGEMLRGLGRHPWRPAHIHMIVSARGHVPVTTHVFARDSQYLDSDAVFGVKESLIADFVPNHSAADARKYNIQSPFNLVEFDFVLKKA